METYSDESDGAQREPKREPRDYIDDLLGEFGDAEFAQIVYPRQLRAFTGEIAALRVENAELRTQLGKQS